MRIFTGKCNISQSGSGSGFWQVAITNFNDPGGLDATEIQVGDFLIFTEAGNTYKLAITQVVSAVSNSATIKVSSVGVTGISSVPTLSGAAISRGSSTYDLTPFVANISSNDNQLFSEYNTAVLDDLIGNIETLYTSSGTVQDGTKASYDLYGDTEDYESFLGFGFPDAYDGFNAFGFFSNTPYGNFSMGIHEEAGEGHIRLVRRSPNGSLTVLNVDNYLEMYSLNTATSATGTFRVGLAGTQYYGTGSPFNRGIVYGGDYSATYTNRSLVDKDYVDSKKPYKVYAALLNQTGTGIPTATVLENTLGGPITFSRSGPGSYLIVSAGDLFGGDASKVFILCNLGASGAVRNLGIYYLNPTEIQIEVGNWDGVTFTGEDDQLVNTSVEIRIYN